MRPVLKSNNRGHRIFIPSRLLYYRSTVAQQWTHSVQKSYVSFIIHHSMITVYIRVSHPEAPHKYDGALCGHVRTQFHHLETCELDNVAIQHNPSVVCTHG